MRQAVSKAGILDAGSRALWASCRFDFMPFCLCALIGKSVNGCLSGKCGRKEMVVTSLSAVSSGPRLSLHSVSLGINFGGKKRCGHGQANHKLVSVILE